MLDVLASPVGHLLALLHEVLSTVLTPGGGAAWGLSIVLLTVAVRLTLFPLFVKQVRSQRRMQELAPRVKELQRTHKGDRETLNAELMQLYRQHDAHPAAGCLPLLLQLPVMFALFRVIREFRPGADPAYGLTARMLSEGGRAKVFGAPISAAFTSPTSLLSELDARQATVRAVAVALVVIMGLTTSCTQRQTLARAGAADPQQVLVRKAMLYLLPLSFAVSGALVPIGVLLYWVTTNVWSMGQQAWVLRRMTAPRPDDSAAPTSSACPTAVAPDAAVMVTSTATPSSGRPTPRSAPTSSVSSRRRAGSRKTKARRGGR